MMFRLYDIVYQNSLFRQFKVNELLFVEYKCLNDEQKLKVLSMQNFFMYILGGKKVWRTLQGTYEARAGQAVFVKKGANIVHQFYNDEFCAVIIFLPDHFITETIQQSQLSAPATTPTDAVMLLEMEPVLHTYFQSVSCYFSQEEKPPAALLELKFKELILSVFASGKNQSLAGFLQSLCQKNKNCIREVMETNYIFNIGLEEFARLSNRSLASFKRDFYAIYHTSPGRWLLQKKLSYAKQLLETTDENINELSYNAGFESPSHFIRLFKHHYHITPLQYKKQLTAQKVEVA